MFHVRHPRCGDRRHVIKIKQAIEREDLQARYVFFIRSPPYRSAVPSNRPVSWCRASRSPPVLTFVSFVTLSCSEVLRILAPTGSLFRVPRYTWTHVPDGCLVGDCYCCQINPVRVKKVLTSVRER